MVNVILTGDLYQLELKKFTSADIDYEGNEVRYAIVSADSKTFKNEGIDINEVGVDEYGKKGGAYYKVPFKPNMITDSYQLEDKTAYIVLTSIKGQPTNLSRMFLKYEMSNDKLREDRKALMAQLAQLTRENKQLRIENMSLLRDYNAAKEALGITTSDIDEAEEATSEE